MCLNLCFCVFFGVAPASRASRARGRPRRSTGEGDGGTPCRRLFLEPGHPRVPKTSRQGFFSPRRAATRHPSFRHDRVRRLPEQQKAATVPLPGRLLREKAGAARPPPRGRREGGKRTRTGIASVPTPGIRADTPLQFELCLTPPLLNAPLAVPTALVKWQPSVKEGGGGEEAREGRDGGERDRCKIEVIGNIFITYGTF